MSTSGYFTCRFACIVASLAIAGCSRAGTPAGYLPSASGHESSESSAQYRILYRFNSKSGIYPHSGLVDAGGTLYGTTFIGGAYNGGAVYKLDASGNVTVLHDFGKGSDGANPAAALTVVGTTLYGTTTAGGNFGNGTVFRITTDGVENVLHSFPQFGKSPDGGGPAAPLIEYGGVLYGTASEGGSYGSSANEGGTVFSITLTGTEKTLHTFGAAGDGRQPGRGALLEVGGTFYGTTYFGGTRDFGTVYSVTPGGSETVLYRFSGRDGAHPYAGLSAGSGVLYGTTTEGGTERCGGSGPRKHCGVIFSITTSGSEQIVHSFTRTEGARTYTGALGFNGKLYVATGGGGLLGGGTLLQVDPASGNAVVLHRFGGSNDGATPSDLALFNGVLMGTTSNGIGRSTEGTIYSITP